MSRLYTVYQAAEMSGLSIGTIRRWADEGEFIVFGQKEGIEELTSPTICYLNPITVPEIPPSVIAECQAQNKGMICKGKSNSCKRSIQMQKSSKTLGQELISKGRDCFLYWNEACQEISSRLWLPIETVLQDLGQGSLNLFSKSGNIAKKARLGKRSSISNKGYSC